ncbi:hypothetical protein [Streptomyces sp. UG1]|uniref:hypothetical protein n=1 Tax=Streptomyces sp. UG1 TaxID=3417652 RepID=UPI003CF66C92
MSHPAAAPALDAVLAARTVPGTAVLVVVLRGGHWPYSCGLARTVRAMAPRLAAAGAEVLLLAAEPAARRRAVSAAWRLPFRWLPEAVTEPVARELGTWDPASGRALDALGLLSPDGKWLRHQSYDDPGAGDPPEAFLTAPRQAALPPAPVGRAVTASHADPSVITLGQAAGTLLRALTAADRLARRLPPSSPAAERAERTRARLAQFLDAVTDGTPPRREGGSTAP